MKRALRLLLVDDRKDLLQMYRSALPEHYRVDVATCADAALACLKAREYDVLLTDNSMPPGMTGADMLETLRGEYPRLVRILNSADLSEELKERAYRAGAIATFDKSEISPAQLRSIIEDAFAKAQHKEAI